MIKDPEEGTSVQFVGVYALRWRPEWGVPTHAFVENDDLLYKNARKMYALLLTIEYVDAEDDYLCCPACGYKKGDGHYRDCELGAILSELEEYEI